MVVRFFENMSTSGDNCPTSAHTSCNCNTCKEQTQSSSTSASTSDTTATQTTNNENKRSIIVRDIVGNCKEMRIEDNSHNLRIVGNNNRIRITLNMGDITIIGNNTRLKIKTNHGHIKYTGNNGRIILGKDSTEQLVDYSGCNGVLKVQNSKKSNQLNDYDDEDDDDDDKTKHNVMNRGSPCTSFKRKLNTNKVKYASYSGSPTDSEVFKCQSDYNNIFNRKLSMPNITATALHSENVSSTRSPELQKSIIHNFGNIVIANSSNISISPHSYIY